MPASRRINKDDIIRVCLDIVRKDGINGINARRVAKELNCSTEHFGKATTPTNAKYTLDEILIENSSYANISRLKQRLVNEKRLEY